MTVTIDLSSSVPLERPEAVEMGREEYRRLHDLVASLTEEQWQRQTDCTEWTVRDLVGHVAGMMRADTAFRRFAIEQVRAALRARKGGTDPVDAMTALQVERMSGLSTAGLVGTIEGLIDPAADGRARVPNAFARRATFPVPVNGVDEPWSIDYLFGTIVTRDTWLHRVADVSRAVGVEPRLDASHDGRIVADVVAEWVRRHEQPVDLTLTGPAGGHFVHGTDGPRLELDAVEYCRVLSGRSEPTHPLLSTQVPF